MAPSQDARQRELDSLGHTYHHGGDALEDGRAKPGDLLDR
jgi:hypothetical protein